MWAIHTGKRPPLIKTCPYPLEILMTRYNLLPRFWSPPEIINQNFVFKEGKGECSAVIRLRINVINILSLYRENEVCT